MLTVLGLALPHGSMYNTCSQVFLETLNLVLYMLDTITRSGKYTVREAPCHGSISHHMQYSCGCQTGLGAHDNQIRKLSMRGTDRLSIRTTD